jgi:hypothetical protein
MSVNEESDLSLFNTEADGILSDVSEKEVEDMTKQISSLNEHHSLFSPQQEVSPPGEVNISQLENQFLTSSSSSYSPFSPSSPRWDVPVVARDIQSFNDLMRRNKDYDMKWKGKTFDEVFPILNDTIRLESAICSSKAILVKELRYTILFLFRVFLF